MEAEAALFHQDPLHAAPAVQAGAPAARQLRDTGARAGWLSFATAYLAIAGGMHVIWGIVALSNKGLPSPSMKTTLVLVRKARYVGLDCYIVPARARARAADGWWPHWTTSGASPGAAAGRRARRRLRLPVLPAGLLAPTSDLVVGHGAGCSR